MPRGDRIERVFALTGRRIQVAREKAGITKEALASAVRLDRSSIALIESGKQRLPIDRLYEIARALQTTVQRLLPDMNEVFQESGTGEPTVIVHGGPEDNHVKETVLDMLDSFRKQPDGGTHT